MTIQEEIREVIDTFAHSNCLYPDKTCKYHGYSGWCILGVCDEGYRCLMERLDGLGVVIKVEGELPDWLMEGLESFDRPTYQEMLKEAGYVYTEPLIVQPKGGQDD